MSENSLQPIFIVGNSRSGTTLVSNILGLNTEVYSFSEIHFFEQMYRPGEEVILGREDAVALCSRLMCAAREGHINHVDPIVYQGEASELLSSIHGDEISAIEIYLLFLGYETQKHGKCRPCEQTPRYIFYLKEILECIPNAKVIVMIRDPRDIMLSQKNKWKQYRPGVEGRHTREMVRAWSNYHPILLSQMWKQAMKSALNYKNDGRLKWVRFEELIQNSEKVVQDLCDFLGVEYQKDMLQVPASKSTLSKTDSVKQGISTAPIARWKSMLPGADIYWCQKVAGPYIEEVGYSLEKRRFNQSMILLSGLTLPFKAVLALTLNLSQSRNLLQSIKRRFLA